MTSSKKAPVLAAAGLLVVLAGLFGFRLLSVDGAAAAPADQGLVPAPKALVIAKLEIPAWYHGKNRDWPIAFKTDLDLLAPLGHGGDNAAVWFAKFSKPDGARAAEGDAFVARATADPELGGGKVVAGDDPLLLEAEPWCDQATMRFYPDIFPFEGYETRLPGLLVPLTMARSWVARGLAAQDEASALGDFRRAIRLGRLLRQEDVVTIDDLVGLECIRLGTFGIYQWSITHGEADQALLASVVLGEVAPQRLMTSARMTEVDLAPYLRGEGEATRLEVPDTILAAVEKLAATRTERRFLGEVALTANFVRHFGSPAESERMTKVLQAMAASDDDIIRTFGRWNLDHAPKPEDLRKILLGE